MGKASYSPLGQWRNKVGGQVYRIDSGEQIVSAYQPIVKNPRTEDQQATRKAFTNASKFVAGLGSWLYRVNPTGSRRKLRGEIMKRVIANIEAGNSDAITLTALNGKLTTTGTSEIIAGFSGITQTQSGFETVGQIGFATLDFADFVDGEITLRVSIQWLAQDGSMLEKTYHEEVITSDAPTYQIPFDAPTGSNMAIVEMEADGVLTEDAWNRYTPALAEQGSGNYGVNNVYSATRARIFSNNEGRGWLHS